MRSKSFAVLWQLGPRRVFQVIHSLPKFLKLFWRLLRDNRVSTKPKILLLALAAYVLIPIDLVPDFLPVLGQIDDLALIYLGLQAFIRLCPQPVVREHVQVIAAGR
ncbi:MAG: YkvA family protein [Candidatus Binatia bacterium]